MDRELRQQIKHDRFVEEVGHTLEYLSEHKQAVRKYGAIAGAAILVVAGVYGYLSYQRNARQQALREAARVLDAFVGENNPLGGLSFKTQQEKDAAAVKAFSNVATKYAGTKEGLIARFQAATILCDQGKLAECEAGLKEVAAGSDANTASLAKLSLADLYDLTGRKSQAEILLRELMSNPTPVVSKEQAQLALARTISKTKPQEARTLLESLQALDRPPVTRAAVSVLGEMMSQSAP